MKLSLFSGFLYQGVLVVTDHRE